MSTDYEGPKSPRSELSPLTPRYPLLLHQASCPHQTSRSESLQILIKQTHSLLTNIPISHPSCMRHQQPQALPTREAEEVSQLPPTWHLAQEKSPFPRFPPYIVGLPGTTPRKSRTTFIVPCHSTLLPSRSRSKIQSKIRS